MSNSILRDKAKDFVKNIVFLCRNMKSEHKETVLINQLLRSLSQYDKIQTNIRGMGFARYLCDTKAKLVLK